MTRTVPGSAGVPGMLTIAAAIIVFFIVVAAANTSATVQTPPVTVHTSLSRTAVFVGEPVIYTVELRGAPGVDVLLEDLQQDRLQVDGGEITQVDTQHEEARDSVVRRVKFTLVSFAVQASELRIGPLRVRYYSRGPGGATNDTAPTGEVIVPGAIVALRSTIADFDSVPQPRVPGSLRPVPERVRVAPIVGWTFVGLAVLPLIFWRASFGRHASTIWDRIRTTRMRRRRLPLSELRQLEPRSAAECVDAFARLDQTLRHHLSTTTDIPAHALTPQEVAEALPRTHSSLSHDAIAELLAACERARYAPSPPSPQDWTKTLDEAEQVLRQ